MADQYNIFLAVDFMNTDILFIAESAGKLQREILLAIDQDRLSSDGAVRLYRTSCHSYQAITHLMKQYHLPFHEAARPKGVSDASHTNQSA